MMTLVDELVLVGAGVGPGDPSKRPAMQLKKLLFDPLPVEDLN